MTRQLLPILAAGTLAACAAVPAGGPHLGAGPAAPARSAPAQASASPRATAPGQANLPDEPSTNWHRLLPMPFGTLLKASPVALHEVLLFRDEAHPGAAVDGRECYSPNAAAPLFFGVGPERYLLCFVEDRLERVDVSVRIPAADAAARFAHACRIWLQETALQPVAGGLCEGRRDGVAIRARLVGAPEPGSAERGSAERGSTEHRAAEESLAALSLTLSAAALPSRESP